MTSSLGYHTARAFALLGAQVILAELSAEGAEAEKSIREEGGAAHFIQTDVSDQDSVTHLFSGVHQAFGALDVLINHELSLV